MESHLAQEIELSKKYDDILKKRAALLQEMQSQHEQQTNKKKQLAEMAEAARKRNAQLLKDLQEIESCLHTRPLPHPNIVSLETQYWAFVEQEIPEWESFLLGRTSSPMQDQGRSPGRRRWKLQDNLYSHEVTGLPPRSSMKSVI